MIWVIIKCRVYQTKIRSVHERRVIVVWCGLNSRSTWLLTTSVEDFERPSVRKDTLNACILRHEDINFVNNFQINFCLNNLPCYIFQSFKRVSATSIFTPAFVLQRSIAAELGCGGRF